jgi:hypothetical protein
MLYALEGCMLYGIYPVSGVPRVLWVIPELITHVLASTVGHSAREASLICEFARLSSCRALLCRSRMPHATYD